MQLTIGADVAKSSFDIALPLENGNYRTRRKICNTPAGWEQLLAWHKKYAPEAAVGMEATGIYHEGLANALFAAGVRVYVVNPTQIKAYGRSELLRTKTDHTDAKLIARFFQARTKALPAYVPLPPSQRTLRSLVRRLDDLNGMQRMELNRLESADAMVRDGMLAVIDTLGQQIRTVKGAITRHINSHPDLRQRRDLLTTIPGIGSATSATLMACLGDLSQYDDVGQIVAHAGLNPAQRQSGAHQGKARISRVGDARLRAKLYMPAVTGKKHNPILAAFAERLAKCGKPGKVIICALMRKMLHLVWGVLRSGKPFDPSHHKTLA